MGLSVYLPDIASSVPGSESFLRRLESELGIGKGSTHITVWASPKGDGAPTHYDGEDVFSIQLAGTKLLARRLSAALVARNRVGPFAADRRRWK